MNERVIYLVSSGDYSDYGVDAVFDTRELAQMFCDQQNAVASRGGIYNIEERPLNPYEREMREGLMGFMVVMTRDGAGTTERCGFRGGVDGPPRIEHRGYRWLPEERRGEWYDIPGDRFTTWCAARDEAHALKIANERRVQLIASGEWDAAASNPRP